MSSVVVNLPLSGAGGGGGSGDASAANQLVGNNYLNQINNKTPKLFSKIEITKNATQDIFSKYIGVTLTETTTINYTDSSKSEISTIETV